MVCRKFPPSMQNHDANERVLVMHVSDNPRFPWHVGKKTQLYQHCSMCPHIIDAQHRTAALDYSCIKLEDTESTRKQAAKMFADKHPDAAHLLAAQQSASIPCSAPGVNVGLMALYKSDMTHLAAISAHVGPPPAQCRRVGEAPAAYVYQTPNPHGCTDEEQRKFERDLLRLLVVLNVAFFAAEHLFLRYFFATYVDGYAVPGRKQLLGRILDDVSSEAVDHIKESASSLYVTNQSDSWKNMSGTTVTGTVLNAEGTVYSMPRLAASSVLIIH
jgi:hypothetical protein